MNVTKWLAQPHPRLHPTPPHLISHPSDIDRWRGADAPKLWAPMRTNFQTNSRIWWGHVPPTVSSWFSSNLASFLGPPSAFRLLLFLGTRQPSEVGALGEMRNWHVSFESWGLTLKIYGHYVALQCVTWGLNRVSCGSTRFHSVSIRKSEVLHGFTNKNKSIKRFHGVWWWSNQLSHGR